MAEEDHISHHPPVEIFYTSKTILPQLPLRLTVKATATITVTTAVTNKLSLKNNTLMYYSTFDKCEQIFKILYHKIPIKWYFYLVASKALLEVTQL